MSKNFQILKFILIVFILWRIIISFISFFGLSVFPETLPDQRIGWATIDTDYWLKWANWDGGHFRGIAENGYLTFQVVFFPLYPLLILALYKLSMPSLWGGLIISNLAITGALFYLYKLVGLDFEEKIAKRTVFLTLAFPTAFYFTAVYSESLFLFLTVAAFYYARSKNWFLALLFAALSSVTRLTGLVVIFGVVLEYFLKTEQLPTYKQFWSHFLNRIASYLIGLAVFLSFIQKLLRDNDLYTFAGIFGFVSFFSTILAVILLSVFLFQFLFKNFDFKKVFTKDVIYFILALIPFFGYCSFLYLTQNNFWAFVEHESQWQRHLTLPWNGPIIYLKDLLDAGVLKIGLPTQQLIEFIFFILFLVLLVFSYLKLRLSYTVYFALSLLIPISTGTLQAIHRYGLVIFPIFILLALIKNETYSQMWLLFSLTLLGVLTILFINSYWVS